MDEGKNVGLKALSFPFFCCLIMWILYLVHWALKIDLIDFGIQPRTTKGIVGIFSSPFIHHGLNHLVSNTVPLIVAGTGLFYFYKKIAFKVIWMIVILTGIWVWLFARPSSHIGASGIIYGLVCFLFFSGLIRKDRRLMAISLLVTFLYGSMVWGILPVDLSISWEAHLFGSAAGIFVAVYYRKEGPERQKYLWEIEEERENLNSEGEHINTKDNEMTIQYIYKERPDSLEEDKQ